MHDWQNAPHSNAREWRVVAAAEVVSVLGDQLSRVGLSLLVFDRTGSAGLTGLTYAATLLPDLVAGPLLAPLADRYPRRDVMIVCALLQAVLVASMLIPGLPFAALVVAVAGTAILQAPAKAAQTPLIRQILGPRQAAGQGTITIIQQLGQIGGLAGAATVIATLGATAALAADAASFLAVAALLHLGVRRRPAALHPAALHPAALHPAALHPAALHPAALHPAALPRPAASQSPHRAQRRAALRLMTSDPQLRCVTLAVLSVSGSVAPAVVIAPLVVQLNAPTWASGPLLAADCARHDRRHLPAMHGTAGRSIRIPGTSSAADPSTCAEARIDTRARGARQRAVDRSRSPLRERSVWRSPRPVQFCGHEPTRPRSALRTPRVPQPDASDA